MGMQHCTAYPFFDLGLREIGRALYFDQRRLGANDLWQGLTIALHIGQFTHADPAPIGVCPIDATDKDLFGFHPLAHDIGIHANIDPIEIGGRGQGG